MNGHFTHFASPLNAFGEELQRRSAALAFLLTIQDDTGIPIARVLLRQSVQAARAAARYRSGSVDLAWPSLDNRLRRAKALLALAARTKREIEVDRARGWHDRQIETSRETCTCLRASGPDVFAVDQRCNLDDAELAGLHLELCRFGAGRLLRASFVGSRLVDCHFCQTDLRGTRWNRSILHDVKFEYTDLRGVDFSAATIAPTANSASTVTFRYCDLRGANLSGFHAASFDRCRFSTEIA